LAIAFIVVSINQAKPEEENVLTGSTKAARCDGARPGGRILESNLINGWHEPAGAPLASWPGFKNLGSAFFAAWERQLRRRWRKSAVLKKTCFYTFRAGLSFDAMVCLYRNQWHVTGSSLFLAVKH
jgi:hypothetical protein